MPDTGATTNSSSSSSITLISSDGHEVMVSVELARYSKTINAALNSNHFLTVFQFPPGMATLPVLSEIVRYMNYRKEYEGRLDAPQFEIPPDIVRDLTLAADFLDI